MEGGDGGEHPPPSRAGIAPGAPVVPARARGGRLRRTGPHAERSDVGPRPDPAGDRGARAAGGGGRPPPPAPGGAGMGAATTPAPTVEENKVLRLALARRSA